MPELTPADVELFTKGRLKANDPETVRALHRAYAAVRKHCGWHVSPEKTETVTLDGPCDVLLGLPTLKLITLTSVVEDGVTLNVGDLTPSASGRILVKRNPPYRWSSKFRSIVVTMTHGFDSAPDFSQAVLEAIDSAALKVGTGGTGGLKRYKVDDVEREWQAASGEGSQSASGLNESLLEKYVLIPEV
jgi:hypothetical protein